MTEPTPASELGYAAALDELEQILDRLEHADPDVDRIAVDVARAAELVARCRERIEAARVQVVDVVGSLSEAPSDDEDDAG
jgi:exodeoxyribonuclease VII small subunit